MLKGFKIITLFSALIFVGCSTTEHAKTLDPYKVKSKKNFTGEKPTLVVGDFVNHSTYLNGVFTKDKSQRLCKQAKRILKTHVSQSNEFVVMDRSNLETIKKESELRKEKYDIDGGKYVITGEIIEFNRKNQGYQALKGFFGKKKQHVAYGKVAIHIVDPKSKIIYTSQGGYEVRLTDKEVLGFGSTSDYDSALTDKVLGRALAEAVNQMIEDKDKGVWKI